MKYPRAGRSAASERERAARETSTNLRLIHLFLLSFSFPAPGRGCCQADENTFLFFCQAPRPYPLALFVRLGKGLDGGFEFEGRVRELGACENEDVGAFAGDKVALAKAGVGRRGCTSPGGWKKNLHEGVSLWEPALGKWCDLRLFPSPPRARPLNTPSPHSSFR